MFNPEWFDLLMDNDDKGVVVNQVDKNGTLRVEGYENMVASPERMKPNHVDTGQVMFRTDIIKGLRWQLDAYHADGIFISSVYSENQDRFIFEDRNISTYNALEGVNVEEAFYENIINKEEADYQFLPEFKILLDRFIELSPKTVLEIGSLMGWTLKHWITYSAPNAKLISIDLPVSIFVGQNDGRIEAQEMGHSTIWPQWASEAGKEFYLITEPSFSPSTKEGVLKITQELDFLFIDGDHSYDAIKKDFEMYSPMVREGGMIALHDIGRNEMGGGHRFWSEIKDNYKHLEILFHHRSEKGIGIIFK